MSAQEDEPQQPWLARRGSLLQWGLILSASALMIAILDLARLPAVFLIGPIIVCVAAGIAGACVRVPEPVFLAAQALVGCTVAASLAPGVFSAFLVNWPIFISAIAATVGASSVLGWLISRWGVLPGTTGIWGSTPGAASAMVLMAGAFGADQRLVAFMQYLRVLFVSIGSAAVAGLWVDLSAVPVQRAVWFPPLEWSPFALTAAIAAGGAAIATIVRLPAPAFLGPLVLGAFVHLGLGGTFQMPPWLLAASHAAIGMSIGLKFDRAILAHVLRALPQVVLSILVLMGFCGAIAWVLAHELGIDPLTAYLATSPGGLDTIAIVAAASEGVDISFVMTLQTMRLLFLLAFGGVIARLVAGRIPS